MFKAQDEYLRFVFLTGVSKFSKVSLFSGLNNLKDLTFDKKFSSICGYTQSELESTFQDYLQNCDLDELRRWYNGYSWLGEYVYNPFDILLYLDTLEFSNYWFETATPTFIIQLLQDRQTYIPDLESITASEKIIGSFEVDRLEIETLLFQKRVYVIEFKVLEMMSQVRSLKQIKDKGYAEKFAGQEAYLIGVEFSSQNKNIERYEWEAIAQQRN